MVFYTNDISKRKEKFGLNENSNLGYNGYLPGAAALKIVSPFLMAQNLLVGRLVI